MPPRFAALDPGQKANDSFTWNAADYQGLQGPGTVTLNVTGLPQPIVAVDYSFAIGKKNILTVSANSGVLSLDSNPAAGDVLVVDTNQTDILSAGGAKILMRTDGSFLYDPTQAFPTLGQGQPYSDTFTYVVVDSFGNTAQATVHIAVTGVEDLPVAPDYDISAGFWTVPGQAVTVPASQGLLSKAYSPDAGATAKLTAFGKGNSKYGATVTVNPDGSFIYDPTTSAAIQQLTAQGQDVEDSFDYGVADPFGPTVDPQVTIVIKGGQSPYHYNIVASTSSANAAGTYKSLGFGPSINNRGTVAYEGVNGAGKSDLYIWATTPSSGPTPTAQPTAYSILDPSFVANSAPSSDSSQVPFEQFGQRVQVNDSDFVISSREIGVKGLIGALPGGIPDVVETKFLLSYSEIYFGANAIAGNATAAAYQAGVGDSGISASGVQWGNPEFKDMILAGLMGAFTPALGLVGFGSSQAALTNLMLLPRAWIANPIWASLFPTPVDQNWTSVFWNLNRYPGLNAADLTSSFALALSIGPNAIELLEGYGRFRRYLSLCCFK